MLQSHTDYFWERLWMLIAVASPPFIIWGVPFIAGFGDSDLEIQMMVSFTAGLVAAFFMATIIRYIYRVRRDIRQIGEEFKRYGDRNLTAKHDEVEVRKNRYLNIPTISFHFADNEQISNSYNDYFKEPTIEKVVSEMVSELGGEIAGKLPKVLEAKAGSKNLATWISDIKLPDISLAEKFRRWQRETIKQDQVTLGLELVDIDLSDLTAFEKAVSNLAEKFELAVPDNEVEAKRSDLRRRAAEKTITRLEKANGWVLMEGKFMITNLSDEFYKCVYRHPVNEYLTPGETDITIAVTMRKDSLKPNIAGNYAQSVGQSIPLKIYGKVWSPIDRPSEIHELQVTPLAVY